MAESGDYCIESRTPVARRMEPDRVLTRKAQATARAVRLVRGLCDDVFHPA